MKVQRSCATGSITTATLQVLQTEGTGTSAVCHAARHMHHYPRRQQKHVLQGTCLTRRTGAL